MSGKILIFTDLDGTLLNRDTFEFGTIKKYIKYLLSKNISIIPNSSKTEAEILEFNSELGEDLPFISENGAAVHNMDLINHSLPKKIILRSLISALPYFLGAGNQSYLIISP